MENYYRVRHIPSILDKKGANLNVKSSHTTIWIADIID